MDPISEENDGLVFVSHDLTEYETEEEHMPCQYCIAKPFGATLQNVPLPTYSKTLYSTPKGLGWGGDIVGITSTDQGYVYSFSTGLERIGKINNPVTGEAVKYHRWALHVHNIGLLRHFSSLLSTYVVGTDVVQGLFWEGDHLVVLYDHQTRPNMDEPVVHTLFVQKYTLALVKEGDPFALEPEEGSLFTYGGERVGVTCDLSDRALYLSVDRSTGELWRIDNYDSSELCTFVDVTVVFSYETGAILTLGSGYEPKEGEETDLGNVLTYAQRQRGIAFLPSFPLLDTLYPEKKKIVAFHNKLETIEDIFFSEPALVSASLRLPNAYGEVPKEWTVNAGHKAYFERLAPASEKYVARLVVASGEELSGDITYFTKGGINPFEDGNYRLELKYEFVSDASEELQLGISVSGDVLNESFSASPLTESAVELYRDELTTPFISYPYTSGVQSYASTLTLSKDVSYSLEFSAKFTGEVGDASGAILVSQIDFYFYDTPSGAWKNRPLLKIFTEDEPVFTFELAGLGEKQLIKNSIEVLPKTPHYPYIDLCTKVDTLYGTVPPTRSVQAMEAYIYGDEEDSEAEYVEGQLEEHKALMEIDDPRFEKIETSFNNYIPALDKVL